MQADIDSFLEIFDLTKSKLQDNINSFWYFLFNKIKMKGHWFISKKDRLTKKKKKKMTLNSFKILFLFKAIAKIRWN
jgi:hypothetical protein